MERENKVNENKKRRWLGASVLPSYLHAHHESLMERDARYLREIAKSVVVTHDLLDHKFDVSKKS